MGKWSESTKARKRAIKEYQIEESAEAVVAVLKENKATKRGGKYIKKYLLIPLIEEQIEGGRRVSGILELPAIENETVPPSNEKFIDSNWRDICLCAAEVRDYIVFNRDGIRLGTLAEYQECQKILKNIAWGMTDSHNQRAEIINEHGGESVHIGVKVLELPPGELRH